MKVHTIYQKKIEDFKNKGIFYLDLMGINIDKEKRLKEIPKEIFDLNNVKIIDLRYNNLTSIPPEITNLTKLEILHLEHNELSELPKHFEGLQNLRELHLSNNNFHFIPKVVFKLTSLQKLIINNDHISEIPQQVIELEELIELSLNNNRISQFPIELTMLKKIKRIQLRQNNIEKIPKEIVNLHRMIECDFKENPVIFPPTEIIYQGIESIRNFFNELLRGEPDQLLEAKLLVVGEGAAGKTTLCRKLLNPKYDLNDREETTEGIDIYNFSFPDDKERDINVNIWDFGGQEIYHSTHQFFLTKRSLYVLVADTRKDDTDFNYWLNLIELLSEGSPLIIVLNEKEERVININEHGIKSRFNNLVKILKVNFATNRGLQDLKKEISHQIKMLPHIGDVLPKTWINVRKRIEQKAQNLNFIDFNTYYTICYLEGIENKRSSLFLSDYLHDLGVFLHFQNNIILKELIIINPEWGTEAVYKILDNVDVRKYKKGRFNQNDLVKIWKGYEGKQAELLELMIKFELCYKIEDENEYIIPDLLPANEIDFEHKEDRLLKMKYNYTFMPKGIISKFIVKTNHLIKDQTHVWKEGVVLEYKNSFLKAIETYGKKEIILESSGFYAKDLLTITSNVFDKIHSTYKKIDVKKLVPCNCSICSLESVPHYYLFENLVNRRIKGRIKVECDISFDFVSVDSLLDNLFKEIPFKISNPMIQNLKKLVHENKIKKVTGELLKLTFNPEVKNIIHMILARINKLTSDTRNGIITEDARKEEFNKINYSLLNLLDRVNLIQKEQDYF